MLKYNTKSPFFFQGFEQLFEQLDSYVMWVKDTGGRFQYGNKNMLRRSKSIISQNLVGLTDFDLHPLYLAKQYVEDDQWVIKNRSPLKNKIELVRHKDGSLHWFSTTKIPLLDRNNKLIGTAGISERIRNRPGNAHLAFSLSGAIEHIDKNLGKVIPIKELAGILKLSVSQFERRFKRFFGVLPSRFIANRKIERACELLISTRFQISIVGLEVGFYDNSHFTRVFRKNLGLTPREYREKFSEKKT